MGIGFGFFSSAILNVYLLTFDFVAILFFLMFSIFSVGSLTFGLSAFQKITIDLEKKVIDVRYFWFLKKSYDSKIMLISNVFTVMNKLGVHRAFCIESVTGDKSMFVENDIANFVEVKDALLELLNSNEEIDEINFFPGNKKSLIVALIMQLTICLGGLTWK